MRDRSREWVEAGATSVEYALLAVLIAAVIATAVALLGSTVVGLFVVDWPF
ncbi:MAG TPA: Flp family type IVb pilin [Aeromicrobium sp.]|nr:Flp family type IVb pilin [Aeromicrobium sp.]